MQEPVRVVTLDGLTPSKIGVRIRSLWNSIERLRQHEKKVKTMLPHLVKFHRENVAKLAPQEKEYLLFYLHNVNQRQQAEGSDFYWSCAKRLDYLESLSYRFIERFKTWKKGGFKINLLYYLTKIRNDRSKNS